MERVERAKKRQSGVSLRERYQRKAKNQEMKTTPNSKPLTFK